MAPFLTEAIEGARGQKNLKQQIRHKFPQLRKPLSISFWQICQNIWSSQVFTLCQLLMVDPVIARVPGFMPKRAQEIQLKIIIKADCVDYCFSLKLTLMFKFFSECDCSRLESRHFFHDNFDYHNNSYNRKSNWRWEQCLVR